ncbi:hypothetical protein PRIPAC_74228, partial [Pristionchus pacificus]
SYRAVTSLFLSMSDENIRPPPPNETKKQKKKRIQGYVTFKEGKVFGEWVVKKKIDEGGFGKVYLMGNIKNPLVLAALKAEPNEVSGGSAIKMELKVIHELNARGTTPHIPQVYHGAKHTRYCYMIMSLLGENLKTLRKKNEKANADKKDWAVLSVSSWIRLGIQCLYGLKLLHDMGYLHRDIKPNNFALGQSSDPERATMVHLLDFGLARSFAFKNSNGKWIRRLARCSVGFRGTTRYCTPNVHDKLESGRRDDIWSLFYVLIELHYGLPWQHENDKLIIEKVKCNCKDEVVMQNMPKELHHIIPQLRRLDCYQRPDYLGIYQSMKAVMVRKGIQPYDLYDWEQKPNAPKALRPIKAPEWYAPEEFFASDPLGIISSKNGGNGGNGGSDEKTTTINDADVFHMTRTRDTQTRDE